MKGTYIMRAIPPYCAEIRRPAEVIQWLGDRVLLRDLSIALPGKDFVIETDLKSFLPDISEEEQ